MLFILRRRIKDIEEPLSRITDFQNRRQIPTSVTVIRRGPYCAEAIVVENLISFLTELVSAEDMRHAVYFQKLLDHLRSKCVSSSSGTQRKLISFRVGITPYQVCHWSLVRYFSESVDDFDLVYGVDAWTQPAVYAEDIVVDDDGEGQVVEHIREIMPDVCVAIFS